MFACKFVSHTSLLLLYTAIAVSSCIGLPKTRSGKIMRRILRKIAAGQLDQLGDTSTLAEPQVVDQLIQSRPTAKAARL